MSKLESALKDHEIESVLKYPPALDADLLIAVRQGEELHQVSDRQHSVLVDLPVEIEKLAEAKGMGVREYVRSAIELKQQEN